MIFRAFTRVPYLPAGYFFEHTIVQIKMFFQLKPSFHPTVQQYEQGNI